MVKNSPILPRPFSWIRTRRFALGGFPKLSHHWDALETAGFRKIFSCCELSEGDWMPPQHWLSDRLALPDHRSENPPSPQLLAEGLNRLQELLRSGEGSLYLHCWAGMERSPLMATGLLCLEESLSIFSALKQVKSLHPEARPISSHLVVLEKVIARIQSQ